MRAFEDLEKQHRFLARETINGVDTLWLTVDGAQQIGIDAGAAGEVHVEAPKSVK